MEKRKLNSEYRKIAEKLIDTKDELEYIKDSSAKIIYLESDQARKRGNMIICGECEKVQPKNQWAIDGDFTITLYTPNVYEMNDKQIEILLFHELLHVGIGVNTEGAEVYTCSPHDLEDFKCIIDKYGIDWDKIEKK